MQEAKHLNFKIKFDIKELVKEADWSKMYAPEEGEKIDKKECGSQYRMTLNSFNKGLEKFKKEIEGLTEEKVAELFASNAKITKKGLLDKRSRCVLLESGLIVNYDNEYGSHSYDVPSIVASRTEGEYGLKLTIQNVGQQDSF